MKKSTISQVLILAATLVVTGTVFADNIMKAEFRTMQECLVAIKTHSGSPLTVVRDKPDLVTGNLSNGKTFACEKKYTGTKGTYYEGWYMIEK